MTTSGSYTFGPTVGGILDEAAEQAGIDPASINERHISSAKMSLNLMFTEWAARDGDAIYRVATGNSTITPNGPPSTLNSFVLPTGAIDITSNDLNMNYNSATQVEPITRISRQAYLNIPTKTNTGKPTTFYVDRATLNTPTVYLYPIPDQVTVFYFDYMRFVQTVLTLGENPDIETLWIAAAVQGLAARLALKFNPDKYALLAGLAEASYRTARRAGSGNTALIIKGRGFGSSSRTMRGLYVGNNDDTGGR